MNRPIRSVRTMVTTILGAVLVTGVFTSASAAPKGKGGPKSAQEVVMEQQDLLIRECKLSDEQQKTIKEKFKLKLEALAEWEKANADKLNSAQEAAKMARQGSDASAKKTAAENLKELEAGRAQATAVADKGILDALTDDQKATWAGVELAQTTLARYKRANLADDQTAKIKSACEIAAKELAELSGDDKKSKKAKADVQNSLKWAIDNVVLTADQRPTKRPKDAGR